MAVRSGKRRSFVAIALSCALGLGAGICSPSASLAIAAPQQRPSAAASSAFAKGFKNAVDADSAVWTRWMMRTGLYNKAKIEEQVKATAAGGIGLLEVNNFNFFWTDSYSHADSDFTSQLDTFYWLMYYADKYGVKLDWTTGDMYPADIPDNSAYATARDYTYSLEFAASALSFGAPQQIFASNLATDGSWEKIVAVTAVKLDSDKKVLASVDLTDDTTHVTYTPTTVVGADGNVNGTVTISESDLPATSTDGTWYLYTFYKKLNSRDSLDYLSAAATKAWADYWENEILGADYWSTSDSPASKQKVLALFEKVSHAFWEDSLESTRMNYTDAVFDAFKQQRGYDFPKERLINLIVGGAIGANLTTGGPGGGNSAGYYSILNTKGVDFPTTGEDDRKLLNDYLTTLSDLYNVNHLKAYQDYAATHGLTTRVQAAYNYSLDQDSAFGFVGIGETESLDAQNSLDVYRTVAGSSHAQGVNVISSESGANGDFKAGAITWPDWMWIANNQFAGGVNQTVLHVVGYQYAGWGGDTNTWPGDGSANSSGGQADANGPRYPYWQITRDTALGYLAREQYVLQAGRAQNDLAMYYYSFDYGQAGDSTFTYYGDESLAAAGYSYEFVGGSSLDLASVGSDGSIVFKDADSGAVNATYKALVINQTRQTDASGKLIGQIPVDAAKKIAALAKAGGNVVIVGDAPSKAADDADQNRDAEVASAMAAAVADGVLRADTESDLLTTLEQHGITAAAVLDPQTATDLKTYHRSDDGVEYYYLFNQSYTSQEGGVDRQLSIGGTQGAAPVGHDINTVVELDGAPSGVPYLLDAWTGEVTRIAQYEVTADGRYRIPLSLEQAETAIVAIGDESWHTDGLGNLPVVSVAPEGVAATYNSAGDIVLTSRSAGTFEIELLNNGVATTTTVTFGDPAQAIVPATWQLDLVAYEPNAAYRGGDHTHKNAGTVVKQPVEPIQLTELVDWSKLDLRYAEKREGRAEGEAVQGSANSVESAGSGLSGIGAYTTTVTLPSDFNAATGGYELAIEHATATFRVEVNGQQIGFAQNDFSGYAADISSALRPGENTITITVASTIINAGKIYTGAYTNTRAGNLYGYTEPDGLVGA
ncbi:MAG: hypothetical protein KIT69_12040, partial [Propionibacteriaceae bacterium]|nr:hypothetical protein [Propionibacteriaceae bacterium]